MFFAQGGRDYQVTEKDFVLWKNQLKNNKSAEFKFYPGLSHLFITDSGTPSPKDYEIKGNVDEEFLKDLTQFILK
jgi:dienelactone hydrolase